MPDVQLVDMRGVTDKQSYPLSTEITQIGRIKGNETAGVAYIVIPEKGVSRHHAVIEYRNHAFWVMDQGSGNGTKLNNQLIDEESRLKHGDILTFDTYNFMFSEPEMEQSDATVVQASSSQAEDLFDMAFDEDDTEMLPDSSAGTGEATSPTMTPPVDNPVSQQVDTEDAADIIDDIADWGFEEDDSASPLPEPVAEPPKAAPAPEPVAEPPKTAPAPKPVTEPPKPAPEPEPVAEPEKPAPAPAETDPVKSGLVEKTDEGFQPARTMTPDEFDRLFAEMKDEDK